MVSKQESSPAGKLLSQDLARIIDDAAIFAGKDSSLPMLNSIRLESTAKTLIAVATDRFCLGSAVANYLNDEEEPAPVFNTMLNLSQAQMLSRLAKSAKAALTDVAIKVTDTEIVCAFSSGEKLHLPLLKLEFPDWRKFLDRPDEDTPAKVFGVNPQYLARFGRVHGAQRMVLRFTGANRPALVTVGAQFIGAVMPVRLDDKEGFTAPEWIARPSEPEPAQPETVKKPARKSPVKKTAA